MIETVYRTARKLATLVAYTGCGLLVLSALMTTIEVVARKFFNISLVGADELSGYALAISMAWGCAFALYERAHIRVDSLYSILPGRVKLGLDLLALFSMGIFVSFIVAYGFGVLSESISIGSRANSQLQTPLWIPQTFWFAGLVFFLCTIAIVLIYACILAARGDASGVRAIAGATSVEEILKTEGDIKLPQAIQGDR